MDQLQYARQKLTYIYLTIACIRFSPEMSDVRISWTKNTFLVTMIDDLFDADGSKEELVNLIDLVKKWDCISGGDYCSNRVEIIYTALYESMNQLGAIAFKRQGRNVTSHLVDLWSALLKSEMQEYEWARDKSTPTLNEYIQCAHISFALGPVVLITLYFLGTKISEEIITSQEYNSLYKHMSICCRLLNDNKTFQREDEQGKLNSVLLYAIHESGTVTEQEASEEISRIIDCNKRDLLKLVLQTTGSIIPKACKDLFWDAYRVTHLFYKKNDEFTSPVEMLNFANELFFEPVKLL
ncbi:Ent-kaurene synthase [Thalictrum thalictroides]|uniref:Ent-kaurene synthase n=1 Tax=Thalictrum thalictroides TaxID=46969 RepID=A0A7J6WQL7_THATH|nr:Ent-kaurene synthase [Thalictrum thalictroides]